MQIGSSSSSSTAPVCCFNSPHPHRRPPPHSSPISSSIRRIFSSRDPLPHCLRLLRFPASSAHRPQSQSTAAPSSSPLSLFFFAGHPIHRPQHLRLLRRQPADHLRLSPPTAPPNSSSSSSPFSCSKSGFFTAGFRRPSSSKLSPPQPFLLRQASATGPQAAASFFPATQIHRPLPSHPPEATCSVSGDVSVVSLHLFRPSSTLGHHLPPYRLFIILRRPKFLRHSQKLRLQAPPFRARVFFPITTFLALSAIFPAVPPNSASPSPSTTTQGAHLFTWQRVGDCVRELFAWGADRKQRDSSGRIPYIVALKKEHRACAALLNQSSAEPLVWPSPLKFISEPNIPDAKARLEAALIDANREREKRPRSFV